MGLICNYTVDTDKNMIYALVTDQNDQLWIAKCPATGDLENDWTLIKQLEGMQFNAEQNIESIMQVKDDTIYILDRFHYILFAFKEGEALEQYTLPKRTDGGVFEFMDQMLYIQSNNGNHKLYLGGESEVLLFNELTREWEVFFSLSSNEEPKVIKANEDIMIVATGYKHIYLAPTGRSNFSMSNILGDQHAIPYDILFNERSDIFVIVYLDGNVTSFKYRKDQTTGNIQISPFGEAYISGFKLLGLNGRLCDSTNFGGGMSIGLVNALDDGTTATYNSILVSPQGKITIDIVDAKFTIIKKMSLLSAPKFTIYVNGLSLYLDYYCNLYVSKDNGKSWQPLTLNI